MSLHIARLCGVAVAVLVTGIQARAEGNRLLPFWGQPYPYGYARSEAVPTAFQPRRCRHRTEASHDQRHGGSERCNVVLRALD